LKELRIPTRRVSADVFTSDGNTARGYLFHAASVYESGTAEDILSELNDEREFIPFQHEEGGVRTCLLNKLHLVRVRAHDLSPDELLHPEAADMDDGRGCTLWLADGSHVTGRPVVETRVGSTRLIDKLNSAPAFMIFVTDLGVEFVRVDQIVRVVGKEGEN